MIPVGLVLVLVLVGAEGEAKEDRGTRLERLGVLEEEAEQEDRGGGDDDDLRMGRPLETLGREGRVAALEHRSPGRVEEFLAPTKRSLDVPKMDGKVGGKEPRRPGWDQRYKSCGLRPASA